MLRIGLSGDVLILSEMIGTYTLCRLLVKIKSKTCVSFSPKNPPDFLEENLTYS